DVIHSFYVPSFRIKQDLVPGQYTSLWFTPTKLGTFPILCAQFCGLDHAKMRGAIEVLSPEDYDKNILQKGSVSSLAEMGKKLFTDKSCIACHEGPVPMGPRLENIMGKKVELTDGRQVVVDENYLRRSILNPQADIVKGYQAIMPSFQGQLTEQELAALISYIKTKKREPPP
ncbi:MAG: c-type cytochrome, partial [Pseudobdellovibrionaceae bacterium]